MAVPVKYSRKKVVRGFLGGMASRKTSRNGYISPAKPGISAGHRERSPGI